MIRLFTCLFALFFFIPSFADEHSANETGLSGKLKYARYCADSLQDHRRALNVYQELSVSLADRGADSLLLSVEMERIRLLKRTGESAELIGALNATIPIARRLNQYTELSSLLTLKAFMYGQMGFGLEAEAILEEAGRNAIRVNDEDEKNLQLGYQISVQSFLAATLEEKALYALSAYVHLMQVSEKSPAYRSAQIAGHLLYATAFLEHRQLDSAEFYLEKAASYIDAEKAEPDDHYALINYAVFCETKGDYSEAETWLLRALKTAEREGNKHRKAGLYYALYENLQKQGNEGEARLYLTKFAGLRQWFENDRLASIALASAEIHNEKELILSEASKKENFLISTFAAVFLLLSVSAGGAYLRYRRAGERPVPAEGTAGTSDIISELTYLAKADDPSFMVRFQECFPNFVYHINALADQPLNLSELEVCAYTKLNFSTKDIALYRKCSVRSIENRKYRIRKKLQLTPDADFAVWIATIR